MALIDPADASPPYPGELAAFDAAAPRYSQQSFWRAFSGGLPVYAYGSPPAGTFPALLSQECPALRTYEVTTVDATPAIIWSATLTPNSVVTLRVTVKGQENAGSKRASCQLLAVAYRVGAGAILMGPTVVLNSQETDVAFDSDFAVSGNDVRLLVVGLPATIVDWTAGVEAV